LQKSKAPLVRWGSAKLPVVRHALEGSISAYYFTRMGAWFAGSLWVIGFFMVSCRGYDKWDELSGRLAGCFALGVALLPMNIHDVKDGWVHYRGWLHWTCAALLFIVFALTSLLLFTKSDSPNPSPKKKMRNVWYRVCGWAILACIALIGLYGLLQNFDQALYDRIGGCKPVSGWKLER
jgi:peptidoglycan/LPS O-acetylase OafA/YrhL